MPQEAAPSKPDNVSVKKGVCIRLLLYVAFAVFALYVYEIVTGDLRGGYPLVHKALKQKESEAKQYVGSINRAQQNYFIKKGKFTTSTVDLGLGSPKLETYNYRYKILPLTDSHQTIVTSSAKHEELKSYLGATRQITQRDGKRTVVAILCESSRSRNSFLYGRPKPLALPYYSQADNQLHCGEETLDSFERYGKKNAPSPLVLPSPKAGERQKTGSSSPAMGEGDEGS